MLFVRHKFDAEIVGQLWTRRTIALRFQNIPSIEPSDYDKKSAHDAIKRLRESCEQGVVVAATYHSYQPSNLLIGTIGPGDPDKLIGLEQLNGYFHKVVQLQQVECVSYRDYPILAIQPRGGTISAWPTAERHVRAIYSGNQLAYSVASLTPAQLEVVCYEYLHMTGQLSALVMPIGRGLPDIDIYGIRSDGCKVIAQVTHAHKKPAVADKCKQLSEYAGEDTDLIFFGPRSGQEHCERDVIRYIPIEDVFDLLTRAKNSAQYKMIEHMLGRQQSAVEEY